MNLQMHQRVGSVGAAMFNRLWLWLVVFAAPILCQGAFVEFPMTNSLGIPDTNRIRLQPVNSFVAADGSVTTRGTPFWIQPGTNGIVITNLPSGYYVASNAFLVSNYGIPGGGGTSQGLLFSVDVSTNSYRFTRYLHGFYNLFLQLTNGVTGIIGTNGFQTITNGDGTITLDGSNFLVTTNMVTNALGFLPLSPTQTTNLVTNTVFTATNTLYLLLGTAAFSNSAAFQPASSRLTNWANVNTNALQPSNSVLTDFQTLGTNWAYPRSNPSNFVDATITNKVVSTNVFVPFSNSVTASLAAMRAEVYVVTSNPNGVTTVSNAAIAYSTNGNVYIHDSGTNSIWRTLISN